MLRHRKHKTPIWRKGTYEICCYTPERGYFKIKRWNTSGAIFGWKYTIEDGAYIPHVIEHLRGEDGCIKEKITRIEVKIEELKIDRVGQKSS